MVDLVYCLTNSSFFNIWFLYYYVNLRSLISEDIYLSSGIFLSILVFSVSLSTAPELFCDKVFDTYWILSTILLPIKSPLASAAFWIALFNTVLSASVADLFSTINKYMTVFTA